MMQQTAQQLTQQHIAMTLADVDTVAAAEQLLYPFPWTRGNFIDALASGYGAWLARRAQSLTGYAVMMQVLDEVHLLNLAVLPEYQRRGHGTALLLHLFDMAHIQAATRMLLEVRPGNRAGLALYRHLGFVEIGCRRDYYPAHQGREDAIVMARQL
jgi:ribosomal-protein-alanine N-acetyltransferase